MCPRSAYHRIVHSKSRPANTATNCSEVDTETPPSRRATASRRPSIVSLAVLAVSASVLVPLALPAAASAQAGVVSNYTGPGISDPQAIIAGPDGALWFTNYGNNSIGRITTAGVVSNYTGVGISEPESITAGPDGVLWFTNYGNNSIGRMTTDGVVSNYTNTDISQPKGIATGSDGALWFINHDGGSIGRITTAGVVSTYTVPGVPDLNGITAGPDGALWFTSGVIYQSFIGRITTAGVVTKYTSGTFQPYGITAGPDGALWFANTTGDSCDDGSIARMTTAGVVTNSYTGIPCLSDPLNITAGADGELWFTNASSPYLQSITTDGGVTSYDAVSDSVGGITSGPDGSMWFTSNDSIGRITTTATVNQPMLTSTATPTVALGSPISDTATLSNATPDASGGLTFTAYSDSGCSKPVFTSAPFVVDGSTTSPTASFTPQSPGTYYWIASYSGDSQNSRIASACGQAGQSSIVTDQSYAMDVGGTWAGYVLTAPSSKSIASSQIIVTSLTCYQAGESSSWVGFDGYPSSSSTVEQAGLKENCIAKHSRKKVTYVPQYYAWWELYNSHYLGKRVAEHKIGLKDAGRRLTLVPGDKINVQVVRDGGSKVTFSLSAYSSANALLATWTERKTAVSAPSYSSLECITEDPAKLVAGTPIRQPLSEFGVEVFSGCSAFDNQSATTTSSIVQLTMWNDSTATRMATPSQIDFDPSTDQKLFSVAWTNDGS